MIQPRIATAVLRKTNKRVVGCHSTGLSDRIVDLHALPMYQRFGSDTQIISTSSARK
jgi:hypothetical protein